MAHKVRIIGVPMDLGASRRGVDMGPSAMRVAGLQARIKQLGHAVEDFGNVPVKQAEEQHYGDKRAKYLKEIAETCTGLAGIVKRAAGDGCLPLVLGGDHSLAVGSIGGAAASHRKQGRRIGLLWLDAHGDMNTPETTPSGNVHGMPLAALVGAGAPELTGLAGFTPILDARQVALVGVRELDSREQRLMKQSGVHPFTMRDIDERGMREVMTEALRFVTDDTAGIAVSLDMDFVDPAEAPGVGTAVRGGVTYREAHLAMEMIADTRALVLLEVVEINPVIDLHNKTANLGVELVLSGLGKKIL
ncbi:MAG TPA: arginase [Candidatus Acidoferrales bacterium]|nr:arginase [Candidatus Acidoferrales bacterium]